MTHGLTRRTMAAAFSMAALLGLTIHAAADVVDFEDLPLAANSHWNGPDPAGTDQPDPYGGPLPVKVGSFTSGSAKFGNEYNPNYDSWGGFAYSNESDNTTPGFGNQFSAYPGSGAGQGSDHYGVAFGYVNNLDPQNVNQLAELPSIEFAQTVHPLSAAVTNVTYPALTMRDGDPFSKKFGGDSGSDPDWFKLSVYATDAQGNVVPGSVDFFLADFRFADDASDYIVNEWALLDLSPLGSVKRLYFNLTSSDTGQFGMNTPGLFAIDSLQFVHVPEPGSVILAAVGLVGILVVARRRM